MTLADQSNFKHDDRTSAVLVFPSIEFSRQGLLALGSVFQRNESFNRLNMPSQRILVRRAGYRKSRRYYQGGRKEVARPGSRLTLPLLGLRRQRCELLFQVWTLLDGIWRRFKKKLSLFIFSLFRSRKNTFIKCHVYRSPRGEKILNKSS